MKIKKIVILLTFILLSLVLLSCNEKNYKLTLDYGDGKKEVITLIDKGSYILPILDDTIDKHFVGWMYNGEFIEKIDSISCDMLLSTSWVEKEIDTKYTITFNTNGGKLIGCSETIEYVAGSNFDLPIAEKDGYIFIGWFLSPTFDSDVITKISAEFECDLILYARYEEEIIDKNTYTITYELNGGYFLSDDIKYEYTKGEEYRLPEPEKEDFYFDGWYETSDFKNEVTRITKEDAKDYKLYAKWEDLYETRTITYDLEGGHFKDNEDVPTWYYEGKGIKLPEPERNGYEFLGWIDSYNNKCIFELNSKAFANKKLTAKWEKMYKYSNVNLELNGGSLSEDFSSYAEGKITFLPIPSRIGYFFRGYYSNSDFSSEEVTYISDLETGDITLYAKWVEAKMENAYISIYGDSISTYEGMIPEGYSFYYPLYCDSVKSPTDTWWHLTVTNLGANLLVNNSYSGTCVCGGKNQGNDLERMAKLASGGINPDIVIIYLGINDVVSNRTLDYFESSYISMVESMKSMYPSVKIFISTLPYETNTYKKYPGLRETYNIIIRKLANILDCELIELNDAINESNGASTLNDTIHPNKKGMIELANKVTEVINNYYSKEYYKVSYNLDGGTITNSTYINDWYDLRTNRYLPHARKDGYKFLGWYTLENEKIDYIEAGYKGNIDVIAKWEKIEKQDIRKVTIKYRNGETKDINIPYGEKLLDYVNISSGNVLLDNLELVDKTYIVLGDVKVVEVSKAVYEVISKVFKYEVFDDLSISDAYSTNSGKVTCKFTSSDELTLSTTTGYVNPDRYDIEVKIKGEFKYSDVTENYEFKVIVKKIEFASLQNKKAIIGYLHVNTDNLKTNNLIDNSLDIAIYSFARCTNKGTVDISEYSDIASKLRLRKTGTRVLLCLGGYGEEGKGFSVTASTTEGRQKLAKSILEVIKKYHFDGVDIDWEYPGYETGVETSIDRSNYTLLIKEIYETLKNENSDYIISAAIPGGIFGYSRYELDKLNNYLDYINLMTYDLQNSSKVTHHTNLFDGDASPYGSVDQTVKLFINQGVDKNKLVVGAAFYGRCFSLNSTDKILNSTDINSGGKNIHFTNIWNNYISKTFVVDGNVKRFFDEKSKAPYIVDYSGKLVISYDDSESVMLKSKYVIDNDLGGIMFWSFGEDLTYTLISSMYDVLK